MSIRKGIKNVLVGLVSVWIVWSVIKAFTSPEFMNAMLSVIMLGVAIYALNLIGQLVLNSLSGRNPLHRINLPRRKRVAKQLAHETSID